MAQRGAHIHQREDGKVGAGWKGGGGQRGETALRPGLAAGFGWVGGWGGGRGVGGCGVGGGGWGGEGGGWWGGC